MKLSRKQRSIITYAIILVLGVLLYLFYTSSYFDREKPKIDVPSVSYWNLKWEIPINLADSSGIKSYKVSLKIDDEEEKILLKKEKVNKNELEFNLPKPRRVQDGATLHYKVEANDSSKNNLFFGNKAIKEFKIKVDTKPPEARIIAMSNKITRGGSAAVVFYANDEALGNIAVSSGEDSFVAFPFEKEHYYAAIIPWNLFDEKFNANIIVQDKAGNIKKSNIGYTRYFRRYRTSNINLKNSFIDGKIAEMIENSGESLGNFGDRISMFKYVNEVLRVSDKDALSGKILNMDSNNAIEYAINPFKPLINAVIVGLYGDHRKYSIDKQPAGESYHLGIDLANFKNAPISLSNGGVVLLAAELGVHGNTIAIDHGFGVSSIYSHLSTINVKEGQKLSAGEIIGKTGISGLALGDHLHFVVSIQGVSVLPAEWMDSKWLKVNIIDIFNDAREIIAKESVGGYQ